MEEFVHQEIVMIAYMHCLEATMQLFIVIDKSYYNASTLLLGNQHEVTLMQFCKLHHISFIEHRSGVCLQ
jgi:hypothetical protein